MYFYVVIFFAMRDATTHNVSKSTYAISNIREKCDAVSNDVTIAIFKFNITMFAQQFTCKIINARF